MEPYASIPGDYDCSWVRGTGFRTLHLLEIDAKRPLALPRIVPEYRKGIA